MYDVRIEQGPEAYNVNLDKVVLTGIVQYSGFSAPVSLMLDMIEFAELEYYGVLIKGDFRITHSG